MMIFVLLILSALVSLFMLSACKAAARADEQTEKAFNEWLARQDKDAAITDARRRKRCI